jgi:UDP-N-acetylglucosamine 2-epimerase/Cytidylyltransferase
MTASALPHPTIIIPARSGSKRLPGKNLMMLGDKTLLQRCIETAEGVLKRCGSGKIIVVIDTGYTSEQVALISSYINPPQTVLFYRSDALATDDATTEDVVREVLRSYPGIFSRVVPEPLVLMQCTSPFTTVDHVVECIEAHKATHAGITCSVYDYVQQHPTGQCYVFSGRVTEEKNFFGAGQGIISRAVQCPNPARAIDIDTQADFDAALTLLTLAIPPATVCTQTITLYCVSTDRADLGHIQPLHDAACKDKRFRRCILPSNTLLHPFHRQDIVVLQGDRTELLEVAARAIREGCIIAHCAGGERTKGSTDDCTRDALTKLAHLHYPVHQQARQRLLDLQEEDWRICVAGEIGVDDIKNKPLMTAEDLMAKWPEVFVRPPCNRDIVVALHPVTNKPEETERMIDLLCVMLPGAAADVRSIYLSTPNPDPGHTAIEGFILGLITRTKGRAVRLPNLGAHAFRSLMKICGTIIGNSSALITEAPHLGCLPILVGTRQDGRFPSESDGNACGRILDHLYATVTERGDSIRTKA